MQSVGDEPEGFRPAEEMSGGRRADGLDAFDRAETGRGVWLGLLGRRIGATTCTLIQGPADAGPFSPSVTWPETATPSAAALAAAEQTMRTRAPLIEAAERDSLVPVVLAHPLISSEHLIGAVVVELPARWEGSPDKAMGELQWGIGWLVSMLGAGGPDGAPGRAARLEAVLQMVASALEHDRHQAASTAFCTETAIRLDCDRVALGIIVRGHARVAAISHSAHFERATNAVKAIEAAMEEAFDQAATIVHPLEPDSPPLACRAHAELAGGNDDATVCSVPIGSDDGITAVLTLERSRGGRFHRDQVEEAEAGAELAGPVLELRRLEERPLVEKAIDAARGVLSNLVGPDESALKLTAFVLALVLAFMVFARGDYRITAEGMLEAAELRAVVAPFSGYVSEAPARAGDSVGEGELLARLEGRELLLERLKWSSQYQQAEKQAREALALQDASRVEVYSAGAAQAKAELDLVEDRLARVEVRAPFAGLVVGGDLTQRLGAPVEQGEVLFEVAPVDSYRVVLQVNEREIDELRVGQSGELMLAALSDRAFDVEVVRVTPVAGVHEGANRFRVEASLSGDVAGLQPGLEGVAKIEVDRRRLIWIWTHDAVDWLRLQLWRWLP